MGRPDDVPFCSVAFPACLAGPPEEVPVVIRALSVLALACALPLAAQAAPRYIGVNVVLDGAATPQRLSQLAAYGPVRAVVSGINAVTLRTTQDQLAAVLTGTAPAFTNAKARRLLGWRPERSWRTELESADHAEPLGASA